MEDCIFCKIIAGEIPCEKVLKNENFIVIKDANPAVEGHSLVIPKKHFDSFTELDPRLYESFMQTTYDLAEKFGTDFNLVVNTGIDAGQLVKHFHLHFIPRKKGDGYKIHP